MKKAIICFTRVPKPGLTKTRLMGLLSGDQCAELHWAFLRDLARVYDTMDADLFVFHTDDPDWALWNQCSRWRGVFIHRPVPDLGKR